MYSNELTVFEGFVANAILFGPSFDRPGKSLQ